MQVQIDVSIGIAAKAVYRDGAVKLSVSGSMPYGDRTATASIEEGFSEEVNAAFGAAFDLLLYETKKQIVARAQAAQADSLAAAARMGEL